MVNVSTESLYKCTSKEQYEAEKKRIDTLINEETERKLSIVPKAKDYCVSTACVIDGSFVLVSEYDINESFEEAIKKA